MGREVLRASARLRRPGRRAGRDRRGDLFSNTYADQIWELNPLHHANNVNGLSPIHWTEHITARQRDRLDRQLALVEKVVTECRDHPNVIFEPCNEPGAGAPVDPPVALVEQDEVNGWLDTIINAIRAADGGRHLIAGQEAFRYDPWDQPLDRSMSDLGFDIVNVHPLPGTTLGGRTYELGRFMSGDLELSSVHAFCDAAAHAAKPVNLDEDNTASQYTDHFGWTIHRKRAWVAVMSGCHYDMIDFTIRPGLSIGSPAAERDLRVWTWFLGDACEHWELAASSSTDDVQLLDGDLVRRLPNPGRRGERAAGLPRRSGGRHSTTARVGPDAAAYFGFRAVSAPCVPSPQPPAGRWVRRP